MADKTKVKDEIDFLAALERGEVTTQLSLARRISVSVGLINALLKRAMKKGYVKAKAAPYKRYAYYLTPKGFREKSRLVGEYLDVSLDFFRKARSEYAALLMQCEAQGARRVVLAGSGELVEIAQLAARDCRVDIIGLYEEGANAKEKYGLQVMPSLEAVDGIDAIVIVESRAPQQAYDDLRRTRDDAQILAPAFLRITLSIEDYSRADGLGQGNKMRAV